MSKWRFEYLMSNEMFRLIGLTVHGGLNTFIVWFNEGSYTKWKFLCFIEKSWSHFTILLFELPLLLLRFLWTRLMFFCNIFFVGALTLILGRRSTRLWLLTRLAYMLKNLFKLNPILGEVPHPRHIQFYTSKIFFESFNNL